MQIIMKTGITVLIAAAASLAAGSTAMGVAACEKNGGPCRIDMSPVPYALNKARNAVRALSSAERARGVEIVLAPGRYFISAACELDDHDSGMPGAPVVWRAEKPGTVFITTAHACDAAEAKDEGGGVWSVPIPKGAQHEQYFARYYREHEMWK